MRSLSLTGIRTPHIGTLFKQLRLPLASTLLTFESVLLFGTDEGVIPCGTLAGAGQGWQRRCPFWEMPLSFLDF